MVRTRVATLGRPARSLEQTVTRMPSHSNFDDLAGLAPRPPAARGRSRNALVAWATTSEVSPRLANDALAVCVLLAECDPARFERAWDHGDGASSPRRAGPPSGSCRSPNVSASCSSRAVIRWATRVYRWRACGPRGRSPRFGAHGSVGHPTAASRRTVPRAVPNPSVAGFSPANRSFLAVDLLAHNP